jgi:transposase
MRPFAKAIERLDTVPGIARRAAEQIVAELGVDMGRFSTAAHAASWTGICPGNNESAGKRRSGTTPKGNGWPRTALVECAHGAVRKKDSCFFAQYHRLAPRRGGKRAIAAVAHSISVAAHHVLRDQTEYRDLGPRLFDTIQRDRLTRYHARRVSELGYQVELKQKEAAA